ncbi:MAG: hypothetical protein V9E85_04820 [Candidatus Nanopelagicales bacterium]|jgi:lysylphosphatidylglycerol synthetase-like protein (DUF2156 family)
MSDLSPEQFGMQKRPGAVLAVAILVFVGAIVQFLTALIAIILAIRPGEAQELFSQPVSDWYWVLTAVLSFILGMIYVWIGRGMLAGDPQSWMLVNILAIINVVFALFQLPTGNGWTAFFLNLVILGLNNTGASKRWFQLQ